MKTRNALLSMAFAAAALCAVPAFADPFSDTTSVQRTELRMMGGKDVFGANREFLGTIIGVDLNKNLAELQLPTEVAISIDGSRLIDRGDHVIAPTVTRGDTLAMSRAQTGTTVAMDLGTIPSFDSD